MEWEVVVAPALTRLWVAVPCGQVCTELSGALRPNRMKRWGSWYRGFLIAVHWPFWQVQLRVFMKNHGFTTVQAELCLIQSRSSGRCFFFAVSILIASWREVLPRGKLPQCALDSLLLLLVCLLCMLIFKHFLVLSMTTLNYHIYISYTKTHLRLYEVRGNQSHGYIFL